MTDPVDIAPTPTAVTPSPGTGAGSPEAAPPAGAGQPGIFDVAQGPAATPPAASTRPEWMPEQFWDPATGQPRVQEMAKSWTDFRGRISRGEGRLPEKPDAYALPAVEGLPPDLVAADDPLWMDIRAQAHKAGLTQPQLEAVVRPYLAAIAKAAAPGSASPEALQAEITKLGPNGIEVVTNLGRQLEGLASAGVLSPSELAAIRRITTADGVRGLAKLLERGGERPIPTEAMQAESATLADAQRMLRDGYAQQNQALIEQGRAALTQLERAGKLRLPR